jgi:hypothetical protein
VLKNVANVAAGERIAIRFFKGEAQADVVKRTE